jgi:4-amino-4-deoxy-L-arabinose transferase-like glycosyltransferase
MATEQTIQNAVFQLELGRGKRVIQWVAVILFTVFFGLVWYPAVRFNGLEKREAMDMAQLARNYARGQGFTTYVIRPLSLWQMKTTRPDHEQHLMHQPDLYNPPLYPLALAGLFKLMPATMFDLKPSDRVFSPERWVILPFNQICLMITLLLTYLWAKQLFDHRVAVTVGFLLLFSDTLWSYGVSGLPTSLLMLLLLLAMYCLFLADRRRNPVEVPETEEETSGQPPAVPPVPAGAIVLVLVSAVLMGLCFLTRYTSAFLVLPMAVYAGAIMRGRKPVLWGLVYVLVVLAVMTPWLMRNVRVSGSLLGIAQYQLAGDEKLQRSYQPDFSGAYSVHHITGEFLSRSRGLVTGSLNEIGAGLLLFFFGVGLMYGFRRRDVTRLRRTLLACLASAAFGMALIGSPGEWVGAEVFGGNLLVLFLPLVAIYGVAFFYLLLDRIPFRIKLTRAMAIGMFALLCVAPMILTLLPPRRGMFPYPPYIPPYTRLYAGWFDKNDVGCSDLPWAMAWYGDRRTLWLPTTVNDFSEIHDFVAPKGISFLLFTPYMMDQRFQSEVSKGQYKDWMGVMSGKVPQNFPLKFGTLLPPDGEQMILADKMRWPGKNAAPAGQPAAGEGASTPAATNPAPPAAQSTPASS